MASTGSRPPIGWRVSTAAVLAVGVLLVAVWMTTSTNQNQQVTSQIDAAIRCVPSEAVYGETVRCEATQGTIDWGDGHTGGFEHEVQAVGVIPVTVKDVAGRELASTSVTITPDLSVTCELAAEKNVYKMAPSDTSPDGWDYVYLHPDTGDHVGPGDPLHPSDPGLTEWDLVVLGRATEAGECTATSQAADDFDGSFEFTMGSAWEEHSVPFAQLTPWSDYHWKGTQPGFINVTVNVNGFEASERQNIFFSGCT